MKSGATDGEIIDIPDMCGCCQMGTGGDHQPECPLYNNYAEQFRRMLEESLIRYHDIWRELADR